MMINEKLSKFFIYHKGIAVTERLCMYVHFIFGLRGMAKHVVCIIQNIFNRCDVLAHAHSFCFVLYTMTRPKGYTSSFLKSINPLNVLKSTKTEIAKLYVVYVRL